VVALVCCVREGKKKRKEKHNEKGRILLAEDTTRRVVWGIN
jgi:hypothetical protein